MYKQLITFNCKLYISFVTVIILLYMILHYYLNQNNYNYIKDAMAEKTILYPSSNNNKWGYIDSTGNWVVSPNYKYIRYVNHGKNVFLAESRDIVFTLPNKPLFPIFNKNILFDFEGNRITPRNASIMLPFSEGMAVAVLCRGFFLYYTNGLMGFVDESGQWVIPAKYNLLGRFSEGLAWAYFNNKYGFLNKNGEWKFSPQFDDASDFREDKAIVRIGIKNFILNKDGNLVALPDEACMICDFNEGMASAQNSNGGCGFLGPSGEWVLYFPNAETPNYPFHKFSCGLAALKVNELYGYVDKKGFWVIEPKFKSAKEFSEGLAAVRTLDNLVGYIDTNGEWVITPQFLTGGEFISGIAHVNFYYDSMENRIVKMGQYIDKLGNIIWNNSVSNQ